MKTKLTPNTRQFVNLAWMRDGRYTVYGEALLLACLLHTNGAGRDSDDFKDVQRIMLDANLDKE